MSKVSFRLGTPNDDAAIVALSNATFGTPLTLEDWQWFVYGNPNGRNRIYVMEDGGVVGCYCVFPATAKIGTERYAVGFPHHLIIQKPYRSAQAFVDFSHFMFEHEKEVGSQLLITAPNKNSYHPQKSLAGWSDFGQADWLYNPTPRLKYQRCVRITEFAGEFEELVRIAQAEMAFCFEKSAPWLNWRYVERPDDPYATFAFYDSGLEGFIVLKHWQNKTHIVDLWAVTHNAAWQLLAAAESYAIGTELDLWCVQGYPWRGCLGGYGERKTSPQPIITYTFGSTPPPLRGVASFMYGDGDGY